jgi:2-isopropylmalate synthase
VVLGQASDPDILVASAKAFLNGLNRLDYLKSQKERSQVQMIAGLQS